MTQPTLVLTNTGDDIYEVCKRVTEAEAGL